ncbi:hypothetical protein ACFQ07_20330, partial [Actinomadura adrarensis]
TSRRLAQQGMNRAEGHTDPIHHSRGRERLRPAQLSISPRELGTEILALSKMNWNQSRLDGRSPITLQTTDQVKQILRFCDPTHDIATRYAQYM